MRPSNHNSHAYPAGKMIPKRHRYLPRLLPYLHDERRWADTTSTINTTEKHQHVKKSRQYTKAALRTTVADLRGVSAAGEMAYHLE